MGTGSTVNVSLYCCFEPGRRGVIGDGGGDRGCLMCVLVRATRLVATNTAAGLSRVFAIHSTGFALTKKGRNPVRFPKRKVKWRGWEEKETHLHVRSGLSAGGCKQRILRIRQKRHAKLTASRRLLCFLGLSSSEPREVRLVADFPLRAGGGLTSIWE